MVAQALVFPRPQQPLFPEIALHPQIQQGPWREIVCRAQGAHLLAPGALHPAHQIGQRLARHDLLADPGPVASQRSVEICSELAPQRRPVAAHADEPGPAVGEGQILQRRKTGQKQLAVTPHYGFPGPGIDVQRRRMSDMLADQNAVIPGVPIGTVGLIEGRVRQICR